MGSKLHEEASTAFLVTPSILHPDGFLVEYEKIIFPLHLAKNRICYTTLPSPGKMGEKQFLGSPVTSHSK